MPTGMNLGHRGRHQAVFGLKLSSDSNKAGDSNVKTGDELVITGDDKPSDELVSDGPLFDLQDPKLGVLGLELQVLTLLVAA